MGTVLVIAISFAILAFILADFLNPGGGGGYSGPQSADVGEIAGQEITGQQYQSSIDEVVLNYRLSTGREPSQGEMFSLRQQAWDQLISRIGFQEELDRLGIDVTAEELRGYRTG